MGLEPSRKVIALTRRARHARHARWSSAVARLDARMAELERRFAALDRRYAALAVKTRFQIAVLFSIALHVLVALGVTFTLPDKNILKDLNQPLEVVLVNAKSTTTPQQPDALAQANLDGGGNTDARRRAKSPFPVSRDEKRASEVLAAQRAEQLEHEARKMMALDKPPAQVDSTPPPQPETEAPVTPNAAELVQRSLEIARLEAQISREWENYQKRPRRRFIGARTREFRFARYIEDWRIKIERVGELNYPQTARDQKVYGSLLVTVSIKADGSLEKIEINRSSGRKILDNAAVTIVRLAAPFAPFSSDITRDTDILSITRTWTFTRSDQLVTD